MTDLTNFKGCKETFLRPFSVRPIYHFPKGIMMRLNQKALN